MLCNDTCILYNKLRGQAGSSHRDNDLNFIEVIYLIYIE